MRTASAITPAGCVYMSKDHGYALITVWTGSRGAGTAGYRVYSRDFRIEAPGKVAIPGSSDPTFLGDATRWNPEELLLAAASSCHMLWYLHLCTSAGIVVLGYVDAAEGSMREEDDGGGRFTHITLRPQVTLSAGADEERAGAMHETAHHKCFIANTLACPITVEATFTTAVAPSTGS